MPATQRQLTANRQNAQKSTGPQTTSGKIRSSKNAITHGLNATDTVINSPNLKENQQEYDDLSEGLIKELAPRGAFEHQLVETITHCLWRQRRAINAETAHLNRELIRQSNFIQLDPGESEYDTQSLQAAARSIPTGAFSLALLRYEMRQDVRMTRALKILRHLQHVRLLRKDHHVENRAQREKQNMQNEPNSPKPTDLETLEALEVFDFERF